MATRSTVNSYGSIAVSLHWLSAVLVIAVWILGNRLDHGLAENKLILLSFHAPLGIAVLWLTLARIAWWLFADQRPDSVGGIPAWQHKASGVVRVLFYVLLLGMSASGIGMLILSGAGEILLSGEGKLPDFKDYLPRTPHGLGARLLLALFLVHTGAALHHLFVRKNDVLRRMWFNN